MRPSPFRPPDPLVIGLLGGIASGKSAVARLFAGHGLVVVDADAVAREVVARPEVAARLADRFGAEILDSRGALRREALASQVFADPEARADLESITHPLIRAAIEAELTAAAAAGNSVLLDAPLLLETGLVERCHATVFVDTSETVRQKRAARRGWESGELDRRESAQLPLSVKKERSGFKIDNNGPLSDTARQVAAILRQLSRRDGGSHP